jgi:hypothetical protein
MLAKYLSKNGGRVSKRGHTVSDAIDATFSMVQSWSYSALWGQ